MDVTTDVAAAANIDELEDVLSEAAPQFGFLAMELSASGIPEERSDHIHPVNWGWKLDYPIRISSSPTEVSYILSIWCRADESTRPYGAERVARVLGPAIQNWFERRDLPAEVAHTPVTPVRPMRWSKGGLRIT